MMRTKKIQRSKCFTFRFLRTLPSLELPTPWSFRNVRIVHYCVWTLLSICRDSCLSSFPFKKKKKGCECSVSTASETPSAFSSLGGVLDVFHVGEDEVPVVALEPLHELQVAAEFKTPDRLLLQMKMRIKDSEKKRLIILGWRASGRMDSSSISNILHCTHDSSLSGCCDRYMWYLIHIHPPLRPDLLSSAGCDLCCYLPCYSPVCHASAATFSCVSLILCNNVSLLRRSPKE